jgi:hypothetical protein
MYEFSLKKAGKAMDILSQLTKDQFTEMPALSRCHVRLLHWHGVMFPEENFDGEALVEIQRNDAGDRIEFIALVDHPWVVYGQEQIEPDGNLFFWLGGQQMAHMQVFAPHGRGPRYTTDFRYDEVRPYVRVLERQQARSAETPPSVDLEDMKPSRLPTGIKVVNVTPDLIQLTLDGKKITRIRPCGYVLHARERLQLVKARGKVHQTHIMARQYGSTRQGWTWIQAMQERYGLSLLFLGSKIAARAYVRFDETPVILPIPYTDMQSMQEQVPGSVGRMDMFESFPYGWDTTYFTF